MSAASQQYPIGEICNLVKGTSPTLKTEPGDYPLVVTAAFRRTSADWQIEGPAVCVPLVSSTGHGDAAIHRVHYQDGRFALANLLVALQPRRPDLCDAKFLYHLLQTRKDELLVPLMLGTANVSLKERDIAGVSIHLPPIDQQRRIVARIEDFAAKVEEARGLRQFCTEVTTTILGKRIAEIFVSRQHPSWRPGSLGDYVLDDCYGTSEKTNDDVSGTPILRMGNIQDGRLITRSLKYLDIPQKDRGKLILAPGDILVNRTNSAELVGKCAVFDLEGDYGFASYIIRIRLDQTRALPRLVAAYINSPIGRKYMFDEKKQMTGQANVNATTLKNLPLPLPDIDVQAHLLTELEGLQAKVDAVKALQTETAAELDAMLPAILDKAFKGEL
jgi:type I restriction enzyme S subunit